ncbi:MAG TPA: hypothetical protein VFC18_11635 [Burkholderiales bacterium]|nr:hypothetical protein [Burkholderiales bacterium]
MHCELVVSGLFAAGAHARPPALELLIARGRASTTGSEPQSLEEWLGEAFGLAEVPLAVGALSLLGCGRDPGKRSWSRADPVHLRLLRDRAVVVPPPAFPITAQESAALCESLSRHFAPVEVVALDAGRWCATVDAPIRETPLERAGRDPAVPEGMHVFLNEAQMLLHAHPVNEAREARGEPAVNSLWLWGGGRAPAVPPCRWQSVSAVDPLALGLARAAGTRNHALAANAPQWLARAPEDGRHLVVLDALRAPLALGEPGEARAALEALERDWFAPLLAALRAGRFGMVTVHVPDAAASFETVRADLRRFWRRPRPLEHYA